MKKMSLCILIGFCPPLVYSNSLCEGQAIEKEVFSCQIKKKTLSICKSTNLSKDKGYIQYRYGSDSKKLDIEFPKNTQHPKDHFLAGTQEGNGTFGNLQWIRGNRGDHSYVVYTDTVHQSNQKSGVKVYRNSKLIADLKCDDPDDSLDVDLLKTSIPIDTINPDGEKVVISEPLKSPMANNSATQLSTATTQPKPSPIENQLADATKNLSGIFGSKKIAKENSDVTSKVDSAKPIIAPATQNEQKQSQDGPKTPASQLEDAYFSYAFIQSCHATRKGYGVVYVNEVELNKATSIIKLKEKEILSKNPQLSAQKEVLWEKSSVKAQKATQNLNAYNGNNFNNDMKFFCKSQMDELISSMPTQPMKKDF